MAKNGEDDERRPGQGNYLGKRRRNFHITNRCWDMAHEMSLDIGVSHSAIIELAVRDMYVRYHGQVPPIQYADYRRPK